MQSEQHDSETLWPENKKIVELAQTLKDSIATGESLVEALISIRSTAASRRGRIDLRASGVIRLLVEILSSSSSAKDSVHNCLLALECCVRDGDNARELARCAGHSKLLRLLTNSDDATSALAAAVVETSCKFTVFPSKPSALADVGIESKHSQHLPLVYRFESCTLRQPSDNEVCVAISTVQSRMSSQLTTAYKLWGGAVVLARWLQLRAAPSGLLSGSKTILELGSGLGLPGIVSAFCSSVSDSDSRVVLTDYEDDVGLDRLLANAELNKELRGCLAATKVSEESDEKRLHMRPLEVCAFNWDRILPSTVGAVDKQQTVYRYVPPPAQPPPPPAVPEWLRLLAEANAAAQVPAPVPAPAPAPAQAPAPAPAPAAPARLVEPVVEPAGPVVPTGVMIEVKSKRPEETAVDSADDDDWMEFCGVQAGEFDGVESNDEEDKLEEVAAEVASAEDIAAIQALVLKQNKGYETSELCTVTKDVHETKGEHDGEREQQGRSYQQEAAEEEGAESVEEAEESGSGCCMNHKHACGVEFAGSVDVLLGSDIVYNVQSAMGVARSLAYLLRKPLGRGYIVSASPHSRFGISELPVCIDRLGNGLRCSKITFDPSDEKDATLLRGLHDQLQYELYQIQYEENS